MTRTGPPAYAWDWFVRQRLLWREARSRLAASETTASYRYAAVDARAEVVALLRSDYPRDESVRRIVDAVVAEMVFLGRTDVAFSELGLANPPRGLRWWWSALTGEEVDPAVAGRVRTPPHRQLSLDALAMLDARSAMDQVHEGYGDDRAT